MNNCPNTFWFGKFNRLAVSAAREEERSSQIFPLASHSQIEGITHAWIQVVTITCWGEIHIEVKQSWTSEAKALP